MPVVFSGQGIMQGKTFKDTGILFRDLVHPSIENKLFLKDKAIVDKESAEAAELQSLFQEIKNYTINKQHALSNEFIETILNNMPQDVRNLFDYKPTGTNNTLAGDLFEQDIAKIVGSVFQTVEGYEVDYSQINIGTKGATPGKVNITFTYPQLEKIFKGKDMKKVLQSLVTKVVKDTNGDQLYQLRDKQGKIDILSPSVTQAKMEFAGNAKLKRFYDLLLGAPFTAKNYMVKNNSTIRIKLGNTNDYKVYMGTLAFSNPELNQDEKDKIFFASQQTKSQLAQLHKKHVKFVYELIGPGLYYDGVSLGECKFLIVNERNGQNIYVRSTKQLIYDLFTERDTLSGRGRVTHLYLDTNN